MSSLGAELLNHEQILEQLKAGRIFRDGTWSEKVLNGASYDLRIARDRLVTLKRTFKDGEHAGKFTLHEGDTALVSTEEKFCVPWTVVGNMSQKFSLAREGLLVHTGSIVDPGYGMKKDAVGNWVPETDVRAHFYLVNVGQDPIVLEPGQAIVTIQFSEIKEVAAKGEKRRSPLMLEAPDGVGFFSVMKNLGAKQDDLRRDLEAKIQNSTWHCPRSAKGTNSWSSLESTS